MMIKSLDVEDVIAQLLLPRGTSQLRELPQKVKKI